MDIEKLKQQLKVHEGIRLRPYRDTVGKLTIGIGRNLDDVGISEPEAMMLLQNDVVKVLDQLDRAFPWWRNMSEDRQLVLADMCFNMGLGTLSKFVNTLAAMERGDYAAAAAGMMASKWARQVGRRAVRLANMMKGE